MFVVPPLGGMIGASEPPKGGTTNLRPVFPGQKCLTALPVGLAILVALVSAAGAQVAIEGERVYTMAGPPIDNAVVIIREGKITAIGKAGLLNIPSDLELLKAKVVTPGLIDAHSTVGTSGILNIDHDQDQLEHAEPIQPELRAIDALNIHDELVQWVRSYGVTTLHTGHAPGELVSGQTMVIKTIGRTVEDAVLVPAKAVAVTLSASARKSDDKSPGTRGKMIAMLRQQLIEAGEYQRKRAKSEAMEGRAAPDTAQANDEENGKDDEVPEERDLRLETLAQVLAGDLTLMVTADRAQDIASALRLAEEFDLTLWLDSAAEAYLLVDEIQQAGAAVLIHPTMARSTGDRENLSFETASTLIRAGIPVAMQSGYEAYVPKTRVVLFEAALAAANGLTMQQALSTVTIGAARILGVDDRIGSIEVGKDGDIALYDGDPFEYTTHCIGVVIDGNIVSRKKR